MGYSNRQSRVNPCGNSTSGRLKKQNFSAVWRAYGFKNMFAHKILKKKNYYTIFAENNAKLVDIDRKVSEPK